MGRVADQLERIATESVAAGTRAALLFSLAVVAVGAVMTFFIPSDIESPVPPDAELADDLGSLGPIDVEPELAAPVPRVSTIASDPAPELR